MKVSDVIEKVIMANVWAHVGLHISSDGLRLLLGKRCIHICFQKEMEDGDFTTLDMISGISCHIARAVMLKNCSFEEMQLFARTVGKRTTFFPSEAGFWDRKFMPCFTSEFRNKVMFLFSPSAVYNGRMIDLIHGLPCRVSVPIQQTTLPPTVVLRGIGGIVYLFPLLAQLGYPVLLPDGEASFVYESELLPSVFAFICTTLNATREYCSGFYGSDGGKVMGFLLAISSPAYMNMLTVQAICDIFDSVEHMDVSRAIIENIMFNFQIWLSTPVDFQVKTYTTFFTKVMERYKCSDNELFMLFVNVSVLVRWIRSYFWDERTDENICVQLAWDKNEGGKALPRSRPENCADIRKCLFRMAEEMTKWHFDDADVGSVLDACMDYTDRVIQSEMLNFANGLLVKGNECF